MKKILLLGVAFCTTICTFGQNVPTEVKTSGKAIQLNSLRDNWFFQVQAGGSLTFSEGFKDAGFGDILAPHAALSIGKHFAPTIGARLQLGGWQSRNYAVATDDAFSRNYLQVNVDAMFNLSNIFVPYTHEKNFNLYALLGAGYVHGFKNDDRAMGSINSVVPRAGLLFDFRINDKINLNLETTANLMSDDFNGITGGTKYDATLNVMAGMIVKLGNHGFKVVEGVDAAEINRLVNDARAQRAAVSERDRTLGERDREIIALKARLEERPEVVVEQVELEEVVMNAVVVFKIGSAVLQDNQEINIYNAAKYFQDNPNMDVRITGYADRSTGSAAVNQRISEQRAEAVKNILVNRYNIAASRITTEGGGDKVQPFANDAWNRVVIFTAVPKR